MARSQAPPVPLELEPGWEPTEPQLALREFFQARQYECTIKQAVEECGLASGQFHKWMKRDHNFARWWVREQERWYAKQLPKVYKFLYQAGTGQLTGVSSAEVNAAKLFIERFDKRYAPRQKHLLAEGKPERAADDEAFAELDRLLGYYSEAEDGECPEPVACLPAANPSTRPEGGGNG